MKSKQNAKLPQRRVAGLTIRAALEPRPDSGANPAADIFRAVKEDSQKQIGDKAQKPESREVAAADLKTLANVAAPDSEHQPKSSKTPESKSVGDEPLQVAPALNTFQVQAENDSPRAAGAQTRVVSLQPPKPRKFPKVSTDPIELGSNSREIDKTARLFERTKAEELYDLLHRLTLGAEQACSSVRVRRSDLMASTNIKTRVTLDLNLKRLEENGLLEIESRPGEQEGNIYTVFPLPENTK